MTIPAIDAETRHACEQLSRDELVRVGGVSSPYEHEILWYGIEAVAHVHVMRMAQAVISGSMAPEAFMEMYQLQFGTVGRGSGFDGSLKAIERDGIFVPEHAYWFFPGDRTVSFFERNYINRTCHPSWRNKEYAYAWALMDRTWKPSDLSDRSMIEQGIRFGRDLWVTCTEGFERAVVRNAQPERLTELGRRLIAFYSAIIEHDPDATA